MNYNLMPLKYFIDIVQTGGFISAAKKNYVSETAVSIAIRKLEEELGYKLIDRSANHIVITVAGKNFYKKALSVLFQYNEIWYQGEQANDNFLHIHFLDGMQELAITLANKIEAKYPKKFILYFDQEMLGNSINRLLMKRYDALVGFKDAFKNNAKLKFVSLGFTSFDLVFNQTELANYHHRYQELARNSVLYLQYWHSSETVDIQSKMLQLFKSNSDWDCKLTKGVNSFMAGMMNVNYHGGFMMIPEDYPVPEGCHNIVRISPPQLKDKFDIGVGFLKSNQRLEDIIFKAIN